MGEKLKCVGATVLLAFVLAGCAAHTVPREPSPTSLNPNVAACAAAAQASITNGDEISGGNDTAAQYAAARAQFDTAGLKATADVKVRIESLVTNWPDFASIAVFGNVDAYNQALNDIARACQAENIDTQMDTLVSTYN